MLMAPPPLLALLLLLAAAATHAAAKPVQTQSLLATPLSPHPSSAPLEVAQDEDVFAGDLAAAEDDGSSTAHFRVVHRDDFAVNATAAELLAHRLQRDGKRAARISAAAGAARANGTRGGRGGFVAPVVSGLAQGSGEYFTKIGVGTPATQALMVLDTGSDVVWLQCAPCRRCYEQSGQVFDPRRSRSYGAVDCAAPLCRRLDSGGCDLRRRACLYQVAYGDGSVTAGDFATETLTFAGGARVARVALGCGHDNEGLFVAAAGLLGLGRGSLSFPTQISRRYGRSFSYCLVDRTSAGSPASRSSTVTFGSGAVGPSVAAAFTPMVKNPRMETFYYVHLIGISVGGARVPGVADFDLRLDPSSGRGGVIVDSGTSVTRLARPAYSALRDAFRAAAAGLRLSPGGFSLFDTCYDLSGRKVVKVRTVSMHFAGGREAALPPEYYLIPVDSKGTFCFALAGTDGGVSTIDALLPYAPAAVGAPWPRRAPAPVVAGLGGLDAQESQAVDGLLNDAVASLLRPLLRRESTVPARPGLLPLPRLPATTRIHEWLLRGGQHNDHIPATPAKDGAGDISYQRICIHEGFASSITHYKFGLESLGRWALAMRLRQLNEGKHLTECLWLADEITELGEASGMQLCLDSAR